jgi:hypothetical protein
MLVASPFAETRGEVSSTRRAVSIADSQMGGTTHAATAAPTRMPSENTATATAIRTAQLNVLSLPSSSAVTECSPPPLEEGSTTIVAAVRWAPTFLRLRSLPGHPGAGVLPLSLSMRARRGTRNLCPLLAPRGRDTARIEFVGDGLQRCRAARSNLYNDRRKRHGVRAARCGALPAP